MKNIGVALTVGVIGWFVQVGMLVFIPLIFGSITEVLFGYSYTTDMESLEPSIFEVMKDVFQIFFFVCVPLSAIGAAIIAYRTVEQYKKQCALLAVAITVLPTLPFLLYSVFLFYSR